MDSTPEIDLAAAGRAARGEVGDGEQEVAEIIAAPPPLALRLLLLGSAVLLGVLLAWSYFGRYNVIVAVPGELYPAAPMGVIQSDRPARFVRALLRDGDRLAAGQPVFELAAVPGDTPITAAAPATGTLAGSDLRRPGELVSAGQKLAEVVPDAPLIARVQIPNADMGRVSPGREAKVKVAAFPYQQYGAIPGRLESVSRLPFLPEPGPSGAATGPPGPPPYPAEITLEPADESQRRLVRGFRPGLAVTAELIVEKRRILSLLLDRLRSR
jgi:multidrug efflux pump subunit AcrA (membrane-fusion protein)